MVLGLVVIGQTEGYAGHGHSGGTHAAKETHEVPKHNSKPVPHPAPTAVKIPFQASVESPKPLPKPSVHNQEHSHSNAAEHSSNLKHPNAITSNPNSQKTAKNETTHHEEHHDGHHHHWDHERHWHGHHLYWSGSSWVDVANGQPVVAADLTPPVEAAGCCSWTWARYRSPSVPAGRRSSSTSIPRRAIRTTRPLRPPECRARIGCAAV